jgi:PKD repeat protein
VFTRTGTTWTQQQKLFASDAEAVDVFGYSVSLAGNIALIGAHGDDDNGVDSGSAYVFTRTGTTWTQQATLHASDGAAWDWFGISVSLDDNTALIGVQLDDDNGDNSGSAYMFTKENEPPVANFTYTIDDLSVTFDASSSYDPDGNITTWLWDFGDGVVGGGEIVTHYYSTSGIYDVTLTVVDDYGDDTSITQKVTVESYTKGIIFGRIANLTTMGDTISFEMVNTRVITVSPFSWIPYTSGEKITISKDYSGFIGYRFILARCKISI